MEIEDLPISQYVSLGAEWQTLPVSWEGQVWDEALSRALGWKEEEVAC